MNKFVKLSFLVPILLFFFHSKAQVVTLPYFNDFETDTTGWYNELTNYNVSMWEWGTPAFGQTNTAYSGSKAWDINLTSRLDSTDHCVLYSPVFDCSSYDKIDISFYLKFVSFYNQEVFWMEISKDGGQTWLVFDSLGGVNVNWGSLSFLNFNAWSGTSSNGWRISSQKFVPVNNSNAVQFRINYKSIRPKGMGGDGFSMDNFLVKGSSSINLEFSIWNPITYISRVAGTVYSGTHLISIYNEGKDTIFTYNVGYALNNLSVYDSLVVETLVPGQVKQFNLSFNYLIPAGYFTNCVYVSTPGDSISNDSICIQGTGISTTVQIPYFTDFENGSSGWSTLTVGDLQSNWELGLPQYGTTNSAYSGSNAWDINLDSVYSNEARNFLYSPLIDCSVMKRVDLSFFQNRYLDYSALLSIDMSLNNGVSWIAIADSFGYGTNWQSSLGWRDSSAGWIKSQLKNVYVNQQSNVLFRFEFRSFSNPLLNQFDGISIDDFKVEYSDSLNIAVSSFPTNVVVGAPGTSSPSIIVNVQNRGSVPITGFDVGFMVNGVVLFTAGPVSNILNPNAILNFNLGSFTLNSIHDNVCVFVNLPGDTIQSDDTLCIPVFTYNQPTVNMPYSTDFESVSSDWKFVGGNLDATKWEWGLPNYGATNSTHSGVNAWDINLNSPYGSNANSVLYSPYFNCASVNKIDLSFWYNSQLFFNDDGVRLEESKNDGVSWSIVNLSATIHSENWYNSMSLLSSSLPAWTGSTDSWKRASIYGRNMSGASRVLYRFIFNSDASSIDAGFSIDDFAIRQTDSVNLMSSMLTPSGPIYVAEGLPIPDLTLEVKNVGLSNVGAYTVGYAIDGVTVYTSPLSLGLGTGNTHNHFLPGVICPATASSICAFVTIIGDTDPTNDTICMNMILLNSRNIDYTQSFDTGSVDWLPITPLGNQDTKWELGAPAFGSTSSAFSTPNAWDINLHTGYNYSANCSLYTASFNISNSTQKHYLSFMLNYKTEAGWDGLRIEYSNDFALTWQVLGIVNDPQGFNWYTDNSLNSSGLPAWEGNSNGWVPCSYYLNPAQLGNNMIFRFVFTSDAAVNSDGVSIDDFYFGSLPAKDAAFIGFNNSVDTFMTGNAIPTSVILENRGAQNLTSLSISHDVNGTIGSTLFTGNVIPFLPVNINVPGIIAQEGKNILKTYVDDSLDLNSQNDTIVRYVHGFSRKPIPYVESFEGPLPNGWFAVASQNQVNWERGIPAFGVTNTAHSGGNVWDVALNASYRTQQNDTLYSPVFSTLGLSNLQLSFWINYHTNFGHAGVHLQYKIASNNLWTNVDTLLQLYPFSGTMFNGRSAWTGYSFGWQEVKVLLTSMMQNSADLRFRFIYASDNFSALDGFSLDDFSLTGSTSLNEISSVNEFQIYPNPTKDYLYVKALFEIGQIVDYRIYTVEGKEVFGDRLSFEKETLIDVSSLKNGLYLLQIQSRNRNICSYKFIKN